MPKLPLGRLITTLVVFSPLALSGCDQFDPLKRSYMWHPADSNTHNITAMAANPADLTRGRHSNRRRVAGESDAVDRVWSNKTAPLSGGSAGASGAGAGGSAGSAPPAGGT
ncbi:MAG: hypothetical protein EXR07_15965 [Acetobacteraceae bacterium]|nr:hypothetical protein [Acetobacteraceae bacterium]